jgi:hypothetical protein
MIELTLEIVVGLYQIILVPLVFFIAFRFLVSFIVTAIKN